MSRSVTPMIHVPDVRAAAAWYQSVGFELESSNEEEGEMNWAMLSFGEGHVIFNAGGSSRSVPRREVDLYVAADEIDSLYARLRGRLEIQEPPHDTSYGMREFIVRDLNGFWVTFGMPIEDA